MNGLSNDELRVKLNIQKEIQNATSDINQEIEKIKNEIDDNNDFDKGGTFNQIDKLNEDAYKISEETLNKISVLLLL